MPKAMTACAQACQNLFAALLKTVGKICGYNFAASSYKLADFNNDVRQTCAQMHPKHWTTAWKQWRQEANLRHRHDQKVQSLLHQQPLLSQLGKPRRWLEAKLAPNLPLRKVLARGKPEPDRIFPYSRQILSPVQLILAVFFVWASWETMIHIEYASADIWGYLATGLDHDSSLRHYYHYYNLFSIALEGCYVLILLVFIDRFLLKYQVFGLRGFTPRLWVTVLVVLLAWLVMSQLDEWVVDLVDRLQGDTVVFTNQEQIEDETLYSAVVPTLIWIGIIGPITEEYIFRKFFFGIVFRGSWGGAVISSCIFSYYHAFVHLIELLPYFVAAMLFCVLYRHFRSIWVPIGLHMFNNTLSTAFTYYDYHLAGEPIYWLTNLI